jgi:hypothetical protein
VIDGLSGMGSFSRDSSIGGSLLNSPERVMIVFIIKSSPAVFIIKMKSFLSKSQEPIKRLNRRFQFLWICHFVG